MGDTGSGESRDRRGKLFVLSGPSGAGKGTVRRRLFSLVPDLTYSVSCTTRPPRAGEVDGRDYRFMSPARFERLVAEGAFLEWAEVYGHRYGTLVAPIEREIASGRNVVLEIDVQGAAKVRERMSDAILIFLAPPSLHELSRRLESRSTEGPEDLRRRLAAADHEMADASWFDHVVVNDDVDTAARHLASIIEDS